jgi:hypothetical protein
MPPIANKVLLIGQDMETPLDRKPYALLVARKLELAAIEFGRKSKRAVFFKRTASSLELLMAVVAIFSNVPIVREVIGSTLTLYVEWSALMILLFVVLVDRFYSVDPPERLIDYNLYMRLFQMKIERNVMEPRTTKSEAELSVLIEIAHDNLADVFSKWPEISRFVEDSTSVGDSSPAKV